MLSVKNLKIPLENRFIAQNFEEWVQNLLKMDSIKDLSPKTLKNVFSLSWVKPWMGKVTVGKSTCHF